MKLPFRWRQQSENSIHLTLEALIDGKYHPVPMFSHDGERLLNEHPAKTQRKAKRKTKAPAIEPVA